MLYKKTQLSQDKKDNIPDRLKYNIQLRNSTSNQMTFGKRTNTNFEEINAPESLYQNTEQRKKINLPKKYQKDYNYSTPSHKIFCAYDNISNVPKKQNIRSLTSLLKKSDDFSDQSKEKMDDNLYKFGYKKPRKTPPSKIYDVLSHYKNNKVYSETNNIYLWNKCTSPEYDERSYKNKNRNNYFNNYNSTNFENLPFTEIPQKKYNGYTYSCRNRPFQRNFSPSDQMSPKENYDFENYSSNDNKNQNNLQNRMKEYLVNTYNYNRNLYDNPICQTDYGQNLYDSYDEYNNRLGISSYNYNTNNQYSNNVIPVCINSYENPKIKNIITNYYDPKMYNSGYLLEKSQEICRPNISYYNSNIVKSMAKSKKLSNIILTKNNNKLTKKIRSCETTPQKLYQNDNSFKTIKIYSNNSNKSSDERSLILNKSNPKKKFLYVSLAMMSSKGPNTENRLILRKMRLDKGGVVDLAQVNFKKNKFKITRAINKGNKSISPFKGGIKGRERAAKIIQSWWRNLKLLSLYYFKQVVLIQSVFKGYLARKNIFDLLSVNYLLLSFCNIVENVLSSVVKREIFYKIFMKKTPKITEQEEEYNIITSNNNLEDLEVQNYLVYLLRKIIENKHVINLSIIHKYLYKWYCITKNENLINTKSKTLLQIRAEKDSKLNLLYSAFISWACQAKLSTIKEKYDQIESKSSNSLNRKNEEKKSKNYEENKNKFIGLFKIIDGADKVTKEKAVSNTYDKIKEYLIRIGRKNKIKNIINNKNAKSIILKRKYLNHWYNKVNKSKVKDNIDVQNNKILEIKAIIFKTIIETSANKVRKNILRKYLYRFFKNALLNKPETREKTNEGASYNKEEVIKIKDQNSLEKEQNLFLDKIKKVMKFSDIIKKVLISKTFPDFINQLRSKYKKEKMKYCLLKLFKNKKNSEKKLLRQGLDKWKFKTLKKTNTSLVTKLFIKIFGIMQKNHIKRLLRKKLNQWSKISTFLNNQNQNIGTGKKIFILSESLISYNKKKNGNQLLETLKKMYNLNKNKNTPKNLNQILIHIFKIYNNKKYISKIRKAFNKWKKCIYDFEIQKLKGKLLYTLYKKYKIMKQKDILLKYLRKWQKYMLYFEKITYKIEIGNETKDGLLIKEKRIMLLKSLIRNLKRESNNKCLRKYLFLWWKNAFKKNKIDEMFTNKINNILKSYINKKYGKIFFNKLNKPLLNIQRKKLLLKLISKINNRNSYLFLKNLFRWKNKSFGIKSIKPSDDFTKMYLGVLIKKNDKKNLQKIFTKWRLFSNQNDKYIALKNVYQLALKKIKQIPCSYAFNLLKRNAKYKNTNILNNKGEILLKILNNISIFSPFKKFINLVKMNNRSNLLSKLLQKTNESNKKKLLENNINKWNNNSKIIKSKSLQKISVWIKKTAKKNKDNKNKRIKELLRRFINKFYKSDKYKLYHKFYLWRKLALILSDKYKTNLNRDFNYEFSILGNPKIVTDIKYKQIIKLRGIVETNQKKYINDLFIRKFDYWRKDNVKYLTIILLIQSHIRQLLALKKLRNKKRLNEVLTHLINKKSFFNKNKYLTFLRKWILIAYTMKCHENMDIIQRFSRKRFITNFYLKTKSFFIRLAKKDILYHLTNIKRIKKLSDAIKRKICKDSFNTIKKCKINSNIIKLLIKIIKLFDNNNRNYILRSYLNKWYNNSKNISDKKTLHITTIQKIFRGYLIRNKINRKTNINNHLLKLINRRGNTKNLLRCKFLQWRRIARNLLVIENAAIIQNFVRKLFRRIASIKNMKNKHAYNNLCNILIKIKITPNDFIRRLKVISRNLILKKLLDKIVDKKNNILKDAKNTIENYAKNNKLYKTIILIDNLKKNHLRNILNNWKLKSVSYKKVFSFLLFIYNKKNNSLINYKHYMLYRWIYNVCKLQAKENANIIKDFCKKNIDKLLARYKWIKLYQKLQNKNKIKDIKAIIEKMKIVFGLKKLENVIKNHSRKNIFSSIRNVKYAKVFIEKIKHLIEDIECNKNKNTLNKFLLKWKNAIIKKNNKEDILKKLFNLLDAHYINNNLNILNSCFLIKKIFDNLVKIRALYFIKKLYSYNNYNKNYKKLSNNFGDAKNYLYNKQKKYLLGKIYRIYVYKILSNLTKNINDKIHKKGLYYYKDFIIVLKNIKNKSNEFSSKNAISGDNLKPQITKLKFKTKIINSNKKAIDKKDNKLIYYKLLPNFINYLNSKIYHRKEYSINKIKNAYSASKFCELYKTYVKKTQFPIKKDFINELKIRINKEIKYIKYTTKLYKLFKKSIIRKIYKYSIETRSVCKILELIKITKTHKKIARDRWLLKLIRKWRLMAFIKAMSTKKMGLMFKNLHSNYIDMANSILEEDGPIKKSDVDKLTRLDIDKYLYNVKDPWITKGGKICEEVKNNYIFPPIKLDEEVKINYENYIKFKETNLSKIATKGFKGEVSRHKKDLSFNYLKKKYLNKK